MNEYALSDSALTNKMLDNIDLHFFTTPIEQESNAYFPDFLKSKLGEWLHWYSQNLRPIVDDAANWKNNEKDVLYNRLTGLINGINEAVEDYYAGRVFEATRVFNNAMDEMLYGYSGFHQVLTIAPGNTFYRARKKEPRKHFTRADLFHVPFEHRYLIRTNRYSIPGLPALYVGDTTYACWEEFDQPDINELWVSRYENRHELNVIELLRYEDFKTRFDKITKTAQNNKNALLYRYIATFPLNIACTIKVRLKDAAFKPEYIIPQLLLQYVEDHKIDGIKYPSTKADYKRLSHVSAYNYVFPVKTIKKKGYCDKLLGAFKSTAPTSLEWEALKYNASNLRPITPNGNSNEKIEFIDGEQSPYYSTAFGRLEAYLQSAEKKLEPIFM